MSQLPEPATILVVDDNPDARQLLEDFLAAQDMYRVLAVSTGQDALRVFDTEAGKVDLVLLDVMMPDISGMEVCRQIKARETGQLTPVIMVTARDDITSKVAGLEGGADDYVTKPISLGELAARIHAQLRNRARSLALVQRAPEKNANPPEALQLLDQANKLATIGALVSEVIHEINNPLNGILNYADLLTEGEVEGSDDVKELLGIIRSEAHRIRQLVESLLTFRRTEPGMSLVDVGRVLEHVLTIGRYQLKKAGVSVTRDYLLDRHYVMGESSRLVQVLLNLVYNALHALELKFGNGEGKRLMVRLEAAEESGGILVVLRDNGPGIPAELLEKILEPEFTTKKAGEGTGLGLAIADSIVKEHGGRLEVRSVLGEYAEFRVWLPRGEIPE